MGWISSEDAFSAWAPDGVLWSQWAKPIAFVHADGGIVAESLVASDDQCECQITSALRRAAGQQGIELDPAGGAERGEHVTMGQSTDDLNGVGGGKQLLAAQHGAQLLDLLGRPVGKVLEGSVLGLAILAITLAQQDGWR